MTSRISHFLILFGTVAVIGTGLLYHLSETNMGVARDLAVRNHALEGLVNHSVAHWAIRILGALSMISLIRARSEMPFTAITGTVACAFWIWLTFGSTPLGLATPWTQVSLTILVVGCTMKTWLVRQQESSAS